MQIQAELAEVASWQALIAEAEAHCGRQLDESLQSYLVFMLMRQLRRADLGSSALGLRLLEQQRRPGSGLRDLGDECLTVAGLFPELARRRLVQVSYYVSLGRSAYGQLAERLSQGQAELFEELTDGFVALMEVLHGVRALGGDEPLSPLECAELWRDTGSQRAADRLRELGGDGGAIIPADQRGLDRRH